MNEFIEKLIGRLEEAVKLKISMRGGRCNGKTLALGYAKGIVNSIEIVNQLAEEYKPKTNADKIRLMSDEELAEFLAETELHGSQGKYDDYLKWLQSEAEYEKGE